MSDRTEPTVFSPDNIGSRDNYALFEFSQSVIVDSAFLSSVLGDSDVRMWIGTLRTPFTNHGLFSEVRVPALLRASLWPPKPARSLVLSTSEE